MVNLKSMQNRKQLPWKHFSVWNNAKDFKGSVADFNEQKIITIHPDDKNKIQIKYNIINPFKKPEEQFSELKSLRSKKDFASFENIFLDKKIQIFLSITKSLEHPIVINLPTTEHFQYGILVKKNVLATIYEDFKQTKEKIKFSQQTSFISLEENACLKFIKKNFNSFSTDSIRYIYNYLHKNSKMYLNYHSINTKTQDSVEFNSLYNVHTFFIEESANFFEQALILAKNKSNFQHYSNVYHLKAYGKSSQLHKVILDDYAKSVFNSLVFIASHCPKVNTSQLNKNISFSKKTKSISQPQLQIKTDDVKAGHGSTTGHIQDEELYYLQSRGISLKKSKQLLRQAFIKEAYSNIQDIEIKKNINTLLNSYDK